MVRSIYCHKFIEKKYHTPSTQLTDCKINRTDWELLEHRSRSDVTAPLSPDPVLHGREPFRTRINGTQKSKDLTKLIFNRRDTHQNTEISFFPFLFSFSFFFFEKKKMGIRCTLTDVHLNV